ncbi:MAG: hypothetical protein GX224_06430 [Thermoplasmatales archaeon]|nr:hypothetical protein [Thermoplasmatales archaeon]
MIRRTPREIVLTRWMSVAAAVWALIVAAYTASDGSATVASVALLALTGVAMIALSGTMFIGSPWGWRAIEFFFFGVAALQCFMIIGGYVPLWGSAPIAAVAVACGLACSTWLAKAWVWRNSV